MAVALRRFHSFSLALAAHFVCVLSAVASPGNQFLRVHDPNVIFIDNNGTTVVYNPITGEQIPQGLATDGSGSGFSLSAVLWIIFSFVVGAPLLFAGFRFWRLTIGLTAGLAAALASWAVMVNVLDNVGVSDEALTACILVLFLLGFGLGLLKMSRALGILVLGIQGGLAIGVRLVLLRPGLLVSDPDAYFVNWLIIGVCGIAGSILVVWRQRYGILNGCASTGSFLCGLAIDLIINQQSGMSRGLRFLFDKNRYHALDTATNGYSPPTTTVIILAVSLGVIPVFAFAQWRAFKQPFWGTKHDTFIGSFWEAHEATQDEESVPQDTPTTEKSDETPSPPVYSASDHKD